MSKFDMGWDFKKDFGISEDVTGSGVYGTGERFDDGITEGKERSQIFEVYRHLSLQLISFVLLP